MTKRHKTLKEIVLSSAGWSVFTMFVWELIEEGLETLLAYAISNVAVVFAIKIMSTLGIVFATQATKVALKRFLVPFIKNLTYKEGNDKMAKFKKFLSWIWANKCTIGGIGAGALTVVSGAGVIDVESFPALVIAGHNVTPLIYYGILGVLAIVCSFFPETIEKFKERIATKNAEKAEAKILKEAKKEIAEEEKTANQTQAQQEKAQAKAENDKKAKEEKEKAEAEHRAKVDAVKAQLKAQAENKTE